MLLVVVIHRTRGSPATLMDPVSWRAWSATGDPLSAMFWLLQAGVLLTACYLLLVSLLTMAAVTVRAPWLAAAARTMTAPALRPVLNRVLGMTLAAATLTASLGPPTAAAAAQHLEPRGHGAGQRLGSAVSSDPLAAVPPWLSAGTPPTGEPVAPPPLGPPLGPAPPAPPTSPGPLPRDRARQAEAEPSAQRRGTTRPAPDIDATWRVEPGDHLWSIAARVVTDHLGGAPDERRIAAYWLDLIAANRDRLVDPDNPDLILPGQRLSLPPLRRAR